MLMRIIFSSSALAALLVAFGCSSSSGDAGVGGGGSTSSTGDDACGWGGGTTIGDTHPGPEETCSWYAFAMACEAEGGFVDGDCYGSGSAWGGTCYAPPPAPAADEFACEDFGDERHVMNCKKGMACFVLVAAGDGCHGHSCEPLPAECAATPTCACVEATYLPIEPVDCTEDAAGNIILRSDHELPPL